MTSSAVPAVITMPLDQNSDTSTARICGILLGHPGTTPVRFRFTGPGETVTDLDTGLAVTPSPELAADLSEVSGLAVLAVPGYDTAAGHRPVVVRMDRVAR